jgi:hypothetical protein
MADILRKKAVLGNQDFTDTRQNLEMVRNCKTQVFAEMETES